MSPVNPVQSPKRLAIVEAAARVFSEQGLARTRMADVAEAADVGKGTVYEYFKSKDDLVFAVLELHDQQIKSSVLAELESASGARERLEAMFRQAAEVIRQHVHSQPMYMEFWAGSRSGPREDEFTRFCADNYQAWRDLVEGVLRAGQAEGAIRADIDLQSVTTMLVAAFDGLGFSYYFDRSLPIDTIASGFLDALCTGICVPEPT